MHTTRLTIRLVGFLSCFRTKEESSVECSRRPQKQPTLLRTIKWRCINKSEWPVWLSGDRTKASYSGFKGPAAAVWQSVQQHWESEWKGSENTKWAQCSRRCHCASQPRIKFISQQEKGNFFSGILRKSPKPPEDETVEQVKTIFTCQNLQESANTHRLNQHHFPTITIEYENMWESISNEPQTMNSAFTAFVNRLIIFASGQSAAAGRPVRQYRGEERDHKGETPPVTSWRRTRECCSLLHYTSPSKCFPVTICKSRD